MKRGVKKREWLYLRENTIKLYDFHACVWNRVMEEEHVCDRWWVADNASHGLRETLISPRKPGTPYNHAAP